jgi:NAD-dependent dihydropyrimidine dehydrogenase PreA subunit
MEVEMKKTRKIIEIDEAKCDGCGQCCLACAEGALKIVDGKAKLTGDIFCDGLGACIGECPQGALKIIERPADAFDDEAVKVHLNKVETIKDKPLPCGCPSSAMMELKKEPCCDDNAPSGEPVSHLGHWPIKLQLLGPQAPFLKDSDLVLMADCAAVAYPDLHGKILKDHAIAIGCPKLDDIEAHIDRLAQIIKEARPKSLTVVHMEVPCCSGFLYAAIEAIERSAVKPLFKRIIIGRNGDILVEEEMAV